MIGMSDSYPSVDWIAFGNYADQWKIIDKDLSHSDIDRIFIATNFEEEQLSDNDDRNLCRYEFFEILVRIAKTKYLERNICNTHWEATEKLILEFLLPNSIDKMDGQKFRDEQLWTLDVNDLFELNAVGIKTIYKKFGTNKKGTSKFMSLKNAVGMIELASLQDLSFANCKILKNKQKLT